jgi:adenylate kinase family enzyme
MQRVSVVGNTGSGKSQFAAALARQLGADHVELDAIVHQADWRALPESEFREAVADRAAKTTWVIDGNYSAVRDLVWERADTVVWLDFRRSVVMRRVIPRTVWRVVRRKGLWNGNREPWRNLLPWDPQRSVIAWAWTRHRIYRRRYDAAMKDPSLGQLRFVRLRSPRTARQFLEANPGETEV